MRLLIPALLLAVATAAGSVVVPAGAADSAVDVQRKLENTRKLIRQAEARERQLKGQIAAAGQRKQSLESEIATLAPQLAGAQARVASAERDLTALQAELESKQAQLESATAELEGAGELLAQRAVRMYKRGPAGLLDFVLGAGDLSDLASRIQFAVRVFASDDARIERISRLRDEVIAERERVSLLRESAAAQLNLVERERNYVASLRNALAGKRDAAASEVRQASSNLETVQVDKATYLRQERELQAESARIAALLRGRTGGTASVKPGQMVWPTSGRISSGYGWRVHPIFGTRKFHSGIDIAAPSGQAIVAAASGVVVFAGPKGGYGNVVIIDHGGGLATTYAHMSSIGASNGQKVAQGQRIGAVGCTGYCTGPHVHFEVRVNGEPRDPMAWL